LLLLILQPSLALASDPTALVALTYVVTVIVPFLIINTIISIHGLANEKYKSEEFAFRQAGVSAFAFCLSVIVSYVMARSIRDFFEISLIAALPIIIFVALPLALNNRQYKNGN